mgnify:FL=1
MDNYVIIVAGGSGKRMGADIPKQFLELAGLPVLMHTISRFARYDSSLRIIVVLPPDHLELWNDLLKKHSYKVPHHVALGGPARFFSVRNGLTDVPDECIVAIHDGVRPLVSKDTIGRCFETAMNYGNAVPVISPADSIRMVTGVNSVAVDRRQIKQIQTPQVFRAGLIKKAYLQEYSEAFTDDATVLEVTGVPIVLVDGNRENIKITTPEDLLLAETLLPFVP